MSAKDDNQQQKVLNGHNLADVHLIWGVAPLAVFFPLLQKGFLIKALCGVSIRAVLCDQLGVTDQYLDERINTIFLDGKPVDDVNSAIIKEDSVLALSAAMPGFVGAAFRKGGYYAVMRKGITHFEESEPTVEREGFFLLKLYNFVAKELGPLFLESGIWLRSNDMKELFRSRLEDFHSSCRSCTVNGRKIDLAEFLEGLWMEELDLVRLRVLHGS
jgi:uncharacterized protein (DUF2164 family)